MNNCSVLFIIQVWWLLIMCLLILRFQIFFWWFASEPAGRLATIWYHVLFENFSIFNTKPSPSFNVLFLFPNFSMCAWNSWLHLSLKHFIWLSFRGNFFFFFLKKHFIWFLVSSICNTLCCVQILIYISAVYITSASFFDYEWLSRLWLCAAIWHVEIDFWFIH